MIDFVHLHSHSSIGSMGDSMVSVEQLFQKASKLKMSAIAITDHGLMGGVFDAWRASKKYGIKFIPGAEFYMVNDLLDKEEKRKHLVLLAENEIGYRNLLRINWEGFINKQYVPVMNKVFPKIDWNIIKKYREGIFCLSACSSGPIARALLERQENGLWDKEDSFQKALQIAKKLFNIFGDHFYLELQPHNLQVYKKNRKTGDIEVDSSGIPILIIDQKYLNQNLIKISKILGVKIVSTCDVHYLEKNDAKIHDLLMAVNSKAPLSDPTRHRYGIDEFYMKSGKEVAEYFVQEFDERVAKVVCKNSCIIAKKCVWPDYLEPKGIRFPQFPIQDEPDYKKFKTWLKKQDYNISEDHAFMRYRCILAFKKMFGGLRGEEKKTYKARIIKEIKVLEQHNFSSYMLIVADYIKKAKEQGIRIGIARGSVAGSLVGYLLGIHGVNPIEYGLIFERFHNKEKKSFPDIDTDIHPDGRAWIQEYITKKYGKEKVAHVSNLSRMTPKVVIKDIARSLELGGSKSKAFQIANKITESIPAFANTFEEAYQDSKEFRAFCEQFPDLKKYGPKLAGLPKAYATHAAGVVISDIDLSTFVPLRLDKDGNVSVQYEKERCEALGLIKMDLLGLDHLKIIENTLANAKKLGFSPPANLYPYNDQKVWNDISKGHTLCVFQMGSPHMRELCKKVKPHSIEELGLVNSLGRPSLARYRNDYIARKNGLRKVQYKYPCLEPALKDSMGICVYEEQLAKIANVVAGWDLNKADNLRKITKNKGKHPELTQKTKEEFVRDAVKYSKISEQEAMGIWIEIIAAFEGYGFNSAHATGYSINGYESAYYSYYYPAAFLAAALESEAGKGSTPSRDASVAEYKKEARRREIKIQAPDINKSGHSYSVKDKKTIVMGFDAIKGIGIKAIENIIQTRNEHNFISFADFLYRTKSSLVRKTVIQALAKAGCFDSLGISRKTAHDFYDIIRTKANKYAKKYETLEAWKRLKDFDVDIKKDEWTKQEQLRGEQEVLGELLSGDVGDLFEGFFTNKGTTFDQIQNLPRNYGVRVEAIITAIKSRKLKRGKNAGRSYAEYSISDKNNNTIQLTVWPDQFVKFKDVLTVGTAAKIVAKVNIYNNARTLVLERIEDMKK